MDLDFVLMIGDKVADFKQAITLNELQDYVIVIDPNEEMTIQLRIGEQEILLDQVYRKEKKPNYKFKTRYRFENIGVQIVHIEANGKLFNQKVRIKPTKISQNEYETMLGHIRTTAYNIIFETFGKTGEEIRLRRCEGPKSPMEFFYFFEKNFAGFKNVFRRINNAPNVEVRKRLKQARFFETENFEEVIEYEKPKIRLSPVQDRLKGCLPKLVTVSENFLSYDVYENRLLKHYLGSSVNKLNYLEEIASNEKSREIQNQEIYGGDPNIDARFLERIEKWQQIIQNCRNYRKDANRMRTSPFLKTVSKLGLVKTSMVLQKEPRYKAFYRLYRDFLKNSVIEVHSEYFHLPLTEVWRTYEIWVLLKVYEALRKIGFILRKQSLVDIDSRYFYDAKKVRFNFGLTKNKPLIELHKEDKIAKMYYQRRYETSFDDYGSVDEKAQVPDMSIEIFKKGEIIPEIVIVDPKYRIAEDKPPESAKKELSHYKNTIRDKHDVRLVKNAHIVYPGKFTASFGKSRDYGYIGLTPTSDTVQFEKKMLEMIS